MLILRRKPGQTIRVGTDVLVTVMGVGAQRVHLGVKAPRNVRVRRGGSPESHAATPEPPEPAMR